MDLEHTNNNKCEHETELKAKLGTINKWVKEESRE